MHVHEPVAPVVGWDALTSAGRPARRHVPLLLGGVPPHAVAALIGARRKLNRLAVRIAVSEAAAWTGRRFYGGDYRVVPNGVEIPAGGVPAPRARAAGEPLRIAFVGQAVERKGLPVLLRAFEALRDHVPAELVIVGATRGGRRPAARGRRRRHASSARRRTPRSAPRSRAPTSSPPRRSGGESFGMVLTEAFAAGTPVVASDIAGLPRRRHRTAATGCSSRAATRPRSPRRCATSRSTRRGTRALGAGRPRTAERYAWPRVAAEVTDAYEAAAGVPAPEDALDRAAVRIGLRPADRPAPPRAAAAVARARARGRAAPAASPAARARRGRRRHGGRAYWRSSASAWTRSAARSAPRARPGCSSRSRSCASPWASAPSLARDPPAALPAARPRLADAMQGTAIGVLMSATLPARLGEPSRALIVARRLGRPREYLPAVLGTLVAQTLLNVVALVILGAVMFATVGLFAGRQQALVWYALAPFAVLCAVLVAPGAAALGAAVALRRACTAGSPRRAPPRRGCAPAWSSSAGPASGRGATVMQLGAWALQWLGCYVLLVALGLEDQADLGAAAAVLFAVNVSAVLPLTPSNLGVFQAACVAVLAGAYGIRAADALGYGIILQAVEIATAVIMGAPALVKEGVSWREVRLRALHSSPVQLSSLPRGTREAEA